MKKKFNINDYKWLTYPILVAVGILFSSTYIFSPELWQKMSQSSDKIKQDTVTANALDTKLKILQQVDTGVETANLNYLLSILPAAKQVPTLISQLQAAGSETNNPLKSFQFDAGDISATEGGQINSDNIAVSASYQVNDSDGLQKLLQNLYARIPLLSVDVVRFSVGQVDLRINSLWSPLAKFSSSPTDKINVSTADIQRIRTQFAAGIPVIEVSSTQSGTVSTGTGNPF